MMKAVGNNQFQKAANMSLILNYLRKKKACSRQNMAEELGLQASTVSYIVGRLLKEGLVEEFSDLEKNSGRIGRRPIMVRLVGEYGYIIGLDLQIDYYCTTVYDVAGYPVMSRKGEYSCPDGDFFSLLSLTVEEIRSDLPRNIPVLGLGLALPGIVDSPTSRILSSWTHRLNDVSLEDYLEKNFPFPVIVENDANCCAQNILWNASGREDDSFIYLLPRFHKRDRLPENLPSVGIGMGLVINGRLYSGFTHQAGEYQSILFSRERQMKWQLGLSEEDMDRALYDRNIQEEIIRELMENMVLILQVLDPRALFIGGDFSGSGDLVTQVLSRDFPEKWQSLQDRKTEIEVRNEGILDPARGAAACMFDRLYTIPQVGEVSAGDPFLNSLLGRLMEESD